MYCIASLCLCAAAHGWTDTGPSQPGDELGPILFGLKQQNVDHLEAHFLRVSDPVSDQYGRYLSIDEIADIVAPTTAAADAVGTWLSASGVDHRALPSRDYLVVDSVNASRLSSMLQLRDGVNGFRAYRNPNNGRVVHRCGAYAIPATVSAHLELAEPTSGAPRPQRRTSIRTHMHHPRVGAEAVPPATAQAAAGEGAEIPWPHDCEGLLEDGMITPAVLKTRYNISNVSSTTFVAQRGSVGVIQGAGLEGGAFLPADLQELMRMCGLPPANWTVRGSAAANFPAVISKCADFDMCEEQTLDVQTVASVAPGVPLHYWMLDNSRPLNMFVQLNNEKAPSLVYSWSAGDAEQAYRSDGGARVNRELMKLGLRGVTMVESSGDMGGYAPLGDDDDVLPTHFEPAFPGTSPYMTVVGGSQFLPRGAAMGGDQIGPEMGVMLGQQFPKKYNGSWVTSGTSGGGFSNILPRPAYQDGAVLSFLAAAAAAGELPPAASIWNASGRGFPDVAMLAGLPAEGGPSADGRTGVVTNYFQRRNGRWVHTDGTSASAPAFAGLVAVMNAARLAAGKPPMGFINPFLYAARANRRCT